MVRIAASPLTTAGGANPAAVRDGSARLLLIRSAGAKRKPASGSTGSRDEPNS